MKLKKLNKIKLHTMTTLYGAPGTSKTTFINTMPGSVLIIDTDRGLASVEQDERFSVAECTSWADVVEALTYAKDFDSIAVDHFTNVQELCYKDIMETNNVKKMLINHYGEASTRLKALGLSSNASYAKLDRILEELEYADKVMKKLGCPVINVANKAIEETAGDILDIMKEKGIHKWIHKDS